jgi:hypothetical protein
MYIVWSAVAGACFSVALYRIGLVLRQRAWKRLVMEELQRGRWRMRLG